MQNVKLLPATGQSVTWVVLPDGCIASDPRNCGELRGLLFRPNASSTWSPRGLFELSIPEEEKIGYAGNGSYGDDTITLAWQGNGLPTFSKQVVAGFATKDVYLGQFPLCPRPFNFSNLNEPQPSLLQIARDTGRIPSTSWAYTAGSFKHVPKVYGSLTLGGYDAARFVPNDLFFKFGPNSLQEFLVVVRSITTDIAPTPLLSTGIYAPINSLVPHLWLPLEACREFERAFGLVWDDRTELYLMSDELHASLTERNPNVTFTLGTSLTGDTVDIVMPYASFDLAVGHPIVNGSRPYFPLKRAANETQFVLGRAFLQSAYLIVDYERGNFSLAQALFPDSYTEQRLTAILPPVNITSSSSSRDGLATAEIAGIAVGAVGAVALVAIAVASWLWRRRRSKQLQAKEESTPASLAEAHMGELDAAETIGFPSEFDGKDRCSEMEGDVSAPRSELDSKGKPRHEMADPSWPPEMKGDQAAVKQDIAPTLIHELPANEVLPRRPRHTRAQELGPSNLRNAT